MIQCSKHPSVFLPHMVLKPHLIVLNFGYSMFEFYTKLLKMQYIGAIH
jgi:hypothetical protein